MTTQARSRALSRITRLIVRRIKPQRIVLFGSFARGESSVSSDLDLLVVKRTRKPRWKRELILAKLLYPPPLPIDHIWRTPKEIERRLKAGDLFYREILEKGRVLYEA